MTKDQQLLLAKQITFEHLEKLLIGLRRSIEEGMVDLEDAYYTEILGLMDEARSVDDWDELIEAIVRAKALEMDIAAWMSRHGRTTVSLSWPKKPK